MDAKIISAFARSIVELVNLEELNFDCDKHYSALTLKDSLKDIFVSLAKLGKLKRLSLNCGALDECIQDQSLVVLSESLKNLGGLKHLFLNFSNSKVGNRGLQAVQEAIGNLKDLESLNLNMLWCEYYSQEVFLELVNSVGKLKFLGNLTLGLRIVEIQEERLKNIGKMMYQLKNLKSFGLRLNCFIRIPRIVYEQFETSLECFKVRTGLEMFIR